jgi:hypothetical protein
MTQKGSLPIVGRKQATQSTLGGCPSGTEECPDTTHCCPNGFCGGAQNDICSSTIKNCNSSDPFNPSNQFCVQAGCEADEYCNAVTCECIEKPLVACSDGDPNFNAHTMICSDDCEDNFGEYFYCNATTCNCEQREPENPVTFCTDQDVNELQCNFTLISPDPIIARNLAQGQYELCCYNGTINGNLINETCIGAQLQGGVWTPPGAYYPTGAGCCINNTYNYCNDEEQRYCCPGLLCDNEGTNRCVNASELVCDPGYVLVQGRHPLDTYWPTQIQIGSQCEKSSQCGSFQYCHPQNFTCQPCAPPGEDCITIGEYEPFCCPTSALFCNESGKCEGTVEFPDEEYEIADAFCCHEDYVCNTVFYGPEYFLYTYPPIGSLQLQTSCCILPNTMHTWYDEQGATQCLCCGIGESKCTANVKRRLGGVSWVETVAICCPEGECYTNEDGSPSCCGPEGTELHQELPYSQGNYKCCPEGQTACDTDLCCEEGSTCANSEIGVLGQSPPVVVPVETEPYCCLAQYSCGNQTGLCCNMPSFECKTAVDNNGNSVEYCCSTDISDPVIAKRKVGGQWVDACCDASDVKDGICCPQETEACEGSCCSTGNCQTINFEYDLASYKEGLCCEEGQVGYYYTLPSGYTAVNPPNSAIGNVVFGCCDPNNLATSPDGGQICCSSDNMQVVDNGFDYYCCPDTQGYRCYDSCCENACITKGVPQYASSSGMCCAKEESYYCTDGCCAHECNAQGYCSECPSGQTECGTGCCDEATQTCINDACCSNDDACYDECCADGYVCADKDEICCSEKKICGGYCCSDNQVCDEGICVSAPSCESIVPKGDSKACSTAICSLSGGECRYNSSLDICECPCGENPYCGGYCEDADERTLCSTFSSVDGNGCVCGYGHSSACAEENEGMTNGVVCFAPGTTCSVKNEETGELIIEGVCTTYTPPGKDSGCYCVESE